MIVFFRLILAALFLGIFSLDCGAHTPIFDTKAKQAYLVDFHSGAVLLAKNSEQKMSPSSMTKMMTAYVALMRLKQNDLKENDLFHTSDRAFRMGGSRMFLEIGSDVMLKDLLLGVLVLSGNDASVAMAEGISGSEEAFATEMNHVGGQLGMTQTNFVNASGWPSQGHYSTAKDIAILGVRTIQDFPEFYKQLYSIPSFEHNGVLQPNRLPLLGEEQYGVDGLKTGFTDDGGYGVCLSCEKKGTRIVLVINGLKTEKARRDEARSLITWAMAQFRTVKVATKDVGLSEFDVWLGSKNRISVATNKDVYFTLARRDVQGLKAEVRVNAPLPAPLKKGDEVGQLIVTGSSVQDEISVPVFAMEDVGAIGFFGKISHGLHYLLFGHSE
ncbi:MAG: D-alanyl-D-alanine carboxypeptidase [Alphaproteobacteria bacterium]|nr:MAG: D-alanyl-D-alanine carboxypeptidase [Alphaproteobacteria bacterium]